MSAIFFGNPNIPPRRPWRCRWSPAWTGSSRLPPLPIPPSGRGRFPGRSRRNSCGGSSQERPSEPVKPEKKLAAVPETRPGSDVILGQGEDIRMHQVGRVKGLPSGPAFPETHEKVDSFRPESVDSLLRNIQYRKQIDSPRRQSCSFACSISSWEIALPSWVQTGVMLLSKKRLDFLMTEGRGRRSPTRSNRSRESTADGPF